MEVLTSDEPAAANDDVEVVVLDETTDKWNVTALMAFNPMTMIMRTMETIWFADFYEPNQNINMDLSTIYLNCT